ncbi:hypothetical protein Bsph_2738 [Lysinibacillus sphaericus C3-41]|uniref:Uncharacterized protein n=1 Tax=Lysinibacillus sphaericus (strain C3-41) TaxID=444177 RepID=B1HZH9_LYSSC|nr:hypothetical protein Bsph_2738 [Lysinibacillus sphaericus C3-41]
MKDKEKATDYFNSILQKWSFFGRLLLLRYFIHVENAVLSTSLE